jgi:uracil-DNA glycosylase
MFLSVRYYYFTHSLNESIIEIQPSIIDLIFNQCHEVLFVNVNKEIMLLNNLEFAESLNNNNYLVMKANKNPDYLLESDIKIMNRFHHTWYNTMYDYLSTNKFLETLKKIAKIRLTNNVFPTLDNQLNVYKMDMRSIKVVIVGLDPYPSDDANGYAFSTNKKVKPVSLRNLELGMINDLKLQKDSCLPNNLFNLIEQGVFLFNTSLTVKKGETKGHLEYWRELVKFTFQTLNEIHGRKLIFIFLGSDAQKNAKYITKHISLSCEHLARCGYEDRDFEHNNIFSDTNRFLLENKQKQITWIKQKEPSSLLLLL